ncbi:alpha/beta hydrolase family protein [Robertkochia solimangrovi]|uniref:alpha/beta hydrolase family protein n=1 Tax=Robertkochia solimangrovi TaxID=2213046 RepID=UPI00117C67CF|nr:alpha/beta hydrolase [Robertkochia solimangrovi]TRZ44319.1 alpha/beta hydrolase [Robertkochia solimangrovi]
MKNTLAILLILFLSHHVSGQNITGDWYGEIQIQGLNLSIQFHISETENGFQSTMDSPDQGATGIPVTTTTYQAPNLTLKVSSAGLEYNGVFDEQSQTINGNLTQMGNSFPLKLDRNKKEKERPQLPKAPFPYKSEDISFTNTIDGITLSGTLTIPEGKGPFPSVVLVSGSGPQNRDSEIMGHKPFWVLADHLSRNGIAVLRYDDRGTAASKGDFKTATTLDLANDAEAAFTFLLNQESSDKTRTGIIGHSEGGIIAPMIAERNDNIAFLILLAAPTLRGDKLMLLQKKKVEEKSGVNPITIEKSQEIFGGAYYKIVNATPETALADTLHTYFMDKFEGGIPESRLNTIIAQLTSPWMVGFMKYDPEPVLEKLTLPILAIYGSNDLQVPPKPNLTIMQEALKKAGNQSATVLELRFLNHLMQESETGLPGEYGLIPQTLSPEVMNLISEWIKDQFRRQQ